MKITQVSDTNHADVFILFSSIVSTMFFTEKVMRPIVFNTIFGTFSALYGIDDDLTSFHRSFKFPVSISNSLASQGPKAAHVSVGTPLNSVLPLSMIG